MALTRLYCHDTYFDATDGFTYTPGMRLTLDPATQSARITRLTNSGVFSTDETLDPSAPGPIGDDTPSTGAFTTLTASGSVTFNGAWPQLKLGAAGQAGRMEFGRGSNGASSARLGFSAADEDNEFDISIQGGAGLLNLHGQNNIIFRTGDIYADAVERVRIDSSGNVGIGTTSPARALHVVGSARITALPTSASGLSAGDLWNDSGTVKVVT